MSSSAKARFKPTGLESVHYTDCYSISRLTCKTCTKLSYFRSKNSRLITQLQLCKNCNDNCRQINIKTKQLHGFAFVLYQNLHSKIQSGRKWKNQYFSLVRCPSHPSTNSIKGLTDDNNSFLTGDSMLPLTHCALMIGTLLWQYF